MSPAPSEIIEARARAGLTQQQAAASIGVARRTWQNWEGGINKMHPSMMELFLMKVKSTS